MPIFLTSPAASAEDSEDSEASEESSAAEDSCALSDVYAVVENVTSDYVEPFAGAEDRLNRALEVIVVTYYAAVIKRHAESLLEGILAE